MPGIRITQERAARRLQEIKEIKSKLRYIKDCWTRVRMAENAWRHKPTPDNLRAVESAKENLTRAIDRSQ